MHLTTFTPGAGGGRPPLTMSSREIAELTGKQHAHVMRDIRNMLMEMGGQSNFGSTYLDAQGKERDCYDLPKRECLILVSGYSVELRARIIDRWMELETGARLSGSRSPNLAREARLQFKMMIGIANAVGIKGNQAALAANNGVKALLGVDVLGSMGTTHLPAPQNEALLTPTDIALRLGDGVTARKVNQTLTIEGYQTAFRDAKGNILYEPTEAGAEAGGTMQDTGKRHSNGTPVRQLKWASSVVEIVRKALADEPVG